MQQKRKTPMRMCTGCGEMRPKQELVRVVRSPDGDISVDLTGKKPGRGAYICRSAGCLSLSRKKRKLERAFSCAITDEVYEKLEKEMISDEGQ